MSSAVNNNKKKDKDKDKDLSNNSASVNNTDHTFLYTAASMK